MESFNWSINVKLHKLYFVIAAANTKHTNIQKTEERKKHTCNYERKKKKRRKETQLITS